MPNHFHWLIVPKLCGIAAGTAVKGVSKTAQITGTSKVPVISATKQQRLTQDIGTLLSSYTKAINKRVGRSGSLFRSKTKAKNGWIDGFVTVNGRNKEQIFRSDNDYALRCFYYIHHNPVKANLVLKATDWEFSSARDYGGLRQGTLCNAALATDILGKEIRVIGC